MEPVTLTGARSGKGNHGVEAGPAVGLASGAAWALALDANHPLAA